MSKPEVYMLCGLTGSGKSTYAVKLAEQSFERLSLDERMRERYGRVGVDFPADNYQALEDTVSLELQQRLVDLLAAGKSVVMDYGFWKKANRDQHKSLIEANGGAWRLLYFKASPDVLRKRLAQRSGRNDANAVRITEQMLESFIDRFEPPENENEEIVAQS